MTTDAATRDALVRFEDFSCGYGALPVLEHINLTIPRGAFVGVVGPSGVGKTTLLRAMVGGVPRTAGRLTVDGRQADSADAPRVGWVPQLETVDWNFPATVREVVLMGRWAHSPWRPWATREDRDVVAALLERLGIAGLADRHIRELSGGQQQRVFLGRALIGDPALLLLDEPTSGVDIKTRDDVLHLLAELNGDGITVVLTTHELNSVAAHLPWVVCVNRGIVAEGPPEDVFTTDVLLRTYGADLRVVHQDGAVLIADAAPHRLRDALRHRHDGYEHAHHEHAGDTHDHEAASAATPPHDHGLEAAAHDHDHAAHPPHEHHVGGPTGAAPR